MSDMKITIRKVCWAGILLCACSHEPAPGASAAALVTARPMVAASSSVSASRSGTT